MAKKKRFSTAERRQIRKIALGAIGGTSAAIAAGGVLAGQPESLILVPVSAQAFRLARKKALTEKEKKRRKKSLKRMFLGINGKRKKTRKVM